MTRNAVICETNALMYVVLSEGENTCLILELVGTTGCKTLYYRFRNSRGRYKPYEPYVYYYFTLYFLRHTSALTQNHLPDYGSIGAETCQSIM
jgi:hypothetical protein